MAQMTSRPWAADPWGSFDELRREMDALFNRFGGSPARSASWRGVFPAVNLYETMDAYVLTAELPGIGSEDIQVAVEGTTVTLQGERKLDYATSDQTSLHRVERPSGSFRRAFELPATVEPEKAEAVHRNGVLILRLPKTEDAQPRQIAVQAS